MDRDRDTDIVLRLTPEGAELVHDALLYLRFSRPSAAQMIEGLLVTLRRRMWKITKKPIYRDRP